METAREADEEHPGHCTQANQEAGSIVFHVGHDVNEKENDRLSGAVCHEDEIMMEFKQEETSEAAAATKTLESNEKLSQEDVESRRLIAKRRTTPKEETQRLKEVSKQRRKCIRDKKRAKRQEEIQRILEDFEGIKKIPGIKSAKRRVPITKIKERERRSHYVTEGTCQCLCESSTKNDTTSKNTKKLNN